VDTPTLSMSLIPKYDPRSIMASFVEETSDTPLYVAADDQSEHTHDTIDKLYTTLSVRAPKQTSTYPIAFAGHPTTRLVRPSLDTHTEAPKIYLPKPL
jgi:hypothetical protein